METRWYTYDLRIDQDKIIAEHTENPSQRIVLLGEKEWELHVDRLIPFCKEKIIDLVLVHGCGRSEYHEKIYSDLGYDIDKVIFFDRHWPIYTETLLSWRMDYTQYRHNDFKYPFISLNNQAHYHRCVLIDTLAKYDIINKGIVSWHDFLSGSQFYEFKYYDKSIRTLPDEFHTKLDSFLIPDVYKECFVDVIAEATHLCPIMSEKTIKPILLQKPFLTLSCKHYYRHVQDLGFKLYDEIFDYSFDDCEDIHERAELLIQNVVKILDSDHKKLYESIKPKLEYNMNNVIKLKKQKISIPDIIREHIDDLKQKGTQKQEHWYRLWDMVDNAVE